MPAPMLQGYLDGAYQWAARAHRLPRLRALRHLDQRLVRRGAAASGRSRTSSHDHDVASIAPWFLLERRRRQPHRSTPLVRDLRARPLRRRRHQARIQQGAHRPPDAGAQPGALGAALRRRPERPTATTGSDYPVSPGATLLFHNAFGPQSDLRFTYRFDHNISNDASPSLRRADSFMAAVVFRR